MSCYIPYADLEATLYSAYRHDFNKYKNLSAVIESVMELSVPAEAKIHAIWYYSGFVNSAAFKVAELQTQEWRDGKYSQIHNYLKPFLTGSLPFDFDSIVEEIKNIYQTELDIDSVEPELHQTISDAIYGLPSVDTPGVAETVDEIINNILSNTSVLDAAIFDPNTTISGQLLEALKASISRSDESTLKYTLLARVDSAIESLKHKFNQGMEYVNLSMVDGVSLHKGGKVYRLRRASGELILVYRDRDAGAYKYFAPGTEKHEVLVDRKPNDQITTLYYGDDGQMINPETGALRMRLDEVFTGIALGRDKNEGQELTVQEQLSTQMSEGGSFYNQVKIKATTYLPELNAQRMDAIREAFPSITRAIETMERPAQASILAQGGGPILTYTRPTTGFTVTVSNFQGDLSFDLKPFINLAFVYPNNNVEEFNPLNAEHIALLKNTLQVRTLDKDERYIAPSDEEISRLVDAIDRYQQFQQEVMTKMQETGSNDININDIFYKYYDLSNNVIKSDFISRATPVSNLKEFIANHNGRLNVKLVTVDANNTVVGEPFIDKIPIVLRKIRGRWEMQTRLPDRLMIVGKTGNTYRSIETYLTEELNVDFNNYIAQTFNTNNSVYISLRSEEDVTKPVVIPLQHQRQVLDARDTLELVGTMLYSFKRAEMIEGNTVMVTFNEKSWGFDVNKDGIRPEIALLKQQGRTKTFGIKFTMLPKDGINTLESRNLFNEYAASQMNITFDDRLIDIMRNRMNELFSKADITLPDDSTPADVRNAVKRSIEKLGENDITVQGLTELHKGFVKNIEQKFDNIVAQHDQDFAGGRPLFSDNFRQYGLFDGDNLKLYRKTEREDYIDSYYVLNTDIQKQLSLTYRDPQKPIKLPPTKKSSNPPAIQVELEHVSPVVTIDPAATPVDSSTIVDIASIPDDPNDLPYDPGFTTYSLTNSLEGFFLLSQEEQASEIAAMKAFLPAAFEFTSKGFDTLQVDGHALGYLQGMFIHINDTIRVRGTAYHEGFHAVFRRLLTREQQIYYLTKVADTLGDYKTDAKGKYIKVGKKKVYATEFAIRRKYTHLNDEQIRNLIYEEYLADGFATYMETNKAPRTWMEKLFKFFKKLLNFFKKGKAIDALYYDIASGKFRNAPIQEVKPNEETVYSLSYYGVPIVINDTSGVPKTSGQYIQPTITAEVRDKLIYAMAKNRVNYPDVTDDALFDIVVDKVLDEFNIDNLINQNPAAADKIRESYGDFYENARWLLGAFHRQNETFLFKNFSTFETYTNRPVSNAFVDVSKNTYNRFKKHVLDEFNEINVGITQEEIEDQTNDENDDTREEVELGESYKDVSFVGAKPHEGTAAFRKLFKYIPYKYTDPKLGVTRTKMVDSKLIFSTLRKISANLEKESIVPRMLSEIDRVSNELNYFNTKVKSKLDTTDIPEDIAKLKELRDQLQAVYDTLKMMTEPNEDGYPTKNKHVFIQFQNVFHKVDAKLVQVFNDTTHSTEKDSKGKYVQRYYLSDIVVWGDISKLQEELRNKFYQLYFTETEAKPVLDELRSVRELFQNNDRMMDLVMVNGKINDVVFREKIVDRLYVALSKLNLGISYNLLNMALVYEYFSRNGKNLGLFDVSSDYKKLLESNKQYWKDFERQDSYREAVGIDLFTTRIENVVKATYGLSRTDLQQRTSERLNKEVNKAAEIYKRAGEFMLKYDPTISGSVTRNANGDMVNKYVDGTPAYAIVNILKNASTVEEGMQTLMKELDFEDFSEFFADNPFFDLSNPVMKQFWQEFDISAFAGFHQTINYGRRETENEPTTFRGIDDKAYALSMLALFATDRRAVTTPDNKKLTLFKRILSQYEATSTSLLVDGIYKQYVGLDGSARMQNGIPVYVEDLMKAIKQEYEMIRRNFRDLGKGVKRYDKYNIDPNKDRGFRFNVFHDLFETNPGLRDQFIAQAKANLPFEQLQARAIYDNEVIIDTIKKYAENQYDVFENKVRNLGITPNDIPKQEGREKGLLKDFFFNDWINTLFVNQLFDGYLGIGVKNYADYFKRQKSGAAAGTNLYNPIRSSEGRVTTYRAGIIKDLVFYIDDTDLTKPMSMTPYEGPGNTEIKAHDGASIGNMDRMIRVAEADGKLDLDAQLALFKMKFLTESTPEYKKNLKLLADRNIVFNNIKSVTASPKLYFKQSEHILIRKDVSYLDPTLDPSFATIELENLYTQMDFYARALEAGINNVTVDEDTGEEVSYQEYYQILTTKAHGFFKPVRGKELLHNFLNSMEMHRIEQLMDTTASKRAHTAPLDYNIEEASTGSYYFDLSSSVENAPLKLTYNQLSTDKVATSVTQGIQQKLLLIAQLDPTSPEFRNIKKDIEGYQKGLADAVLAQTNKLVRLLQTSDKGVVGQIYTTIANGLREQGADATILQYFELNLDGTPKNNPNLRVISNVLVYYYFSLYNKNIFDRKISGRKFYHVSPVGYQIREMDGKIITDAEYRKDPEKYKDATVRYPTVTKDEQGRYVVEVILPRELENVDQEFLEKHLFKFFATRIPTEDKRSMMVAKVVDYIDEAYGAGVIVPYQMHMLSGSDFDIDALYAHFYSSYRTADNTEVVYGDYNHYMTEYQMSEDEAKYVEYLTYMSDDVSIKDLVDIEVDKINNQSGWNTDQVQRYATHLGGNIYKYLTLNETLINSEPKDAKEEKRRNSFRRLIATFNVLDKLEKSNLPTTPQTLKSYTTETGVSPVVNITFNKILDHKMNILSDPAVYDRFMADTEQRADKAAEMYAKSVTARGLKEEDIYNRQNVYTPTARIVARAMNSESKDSLGIAASFNKGVSMLASIGAELVTPVGKMYTRNENGQITEIESVSAGKIVQESVQLIGGAIGVFADAPKKPYPAPLNLNSITTPVMLSMFSVGVPQQAAIMFQSLPIIKELIDEYNRNYNSAYSKETFVRSASFPTFLRRALKEKVEKNKGLLQSKGLLVNKEIKNSEYKLVWTADIKSDTAEEIASNIIPTSNFGFEILDNNNIPFLKEIEDVLVLTEFMNYINLANEISFGITKLTDPMKALKPDFDRFDKLMLAYDKVKNPDAPSFFTYESRLELFKRYPVLRANLDALRHLDETSKLMFMERTSLMRDMISLFDNIYDLNKVDVIADIKGYIQMQLQNAAMSDPNVEDSTLADIYKEELNPENFLDGHIIKDYYDLRTKFPDNTFLRSLKPVQDGRGVIPASLLELSVGKLGSSQKDQMFTDLLILLGSPDKAVKAAAHRIAFHGMIKSGGQKMRGSYFELLPTKFSTYMSQGLDAMQKDLVELDKLDVVDDFEEYRQKLDEVLSKNLKGVSLDELLTDAIAKTISTRIINQGEIHKNTISAEYINRVKGTNLSTADLQSFLNKVVPDARLLGDNGRRIPFTLSPRTFMGPTEVEVFTPVGNTVSLNFNDLTDTDKIFVSFLKIREAANNQYVFPLYRINNYGPDGQTLVLRSVDGISIGERLLRVDSDGRRMEPLVGTTAEYEVVPKMGTSKISPLAFSTEQATAINNILNGIQQLGSEVVTKIPDGAKIVADQSRMYIKTRVNTRLDKDNRNTKFTTWTQATVQTGNIYNVFQYKNGRLYQKPNNIGNGQVVTEDRLDSFANSMGIGTWEEMKNNSVFKDFFDNNEEIHLYNILNSRPAPVPPSSTEINNTIQEKDDESNGCNQPQ